jgi:hypothetical protein
VGQQHVHGDVAATGVSPRSTTSANSHNGGDGRFQIEQSTLVQNHGHAGGGHYFGDRSQIKDAGVVTSQGQSGA